MPPCSIIIPVHNKASLTRQCLDVLLRSSENAAFEIIVVDDASTDTTPQVLAGYGDRIRVVTHAKNSGFATACNDGAAIAVGEYVVFLNNDTIPQAGWLDALVRYAKGHPKAGAVGSKLLFPNDTIQHAGVVICQDRFPRHVYVGFPADHSAVNKSRRFQIVTGGCMLLPRMLFEQVGGFDTIYVNCYEDVDLCLRLGEAGYEIHYCHESVLYHLESVSREGRTSEEDRNTKIYLSRWGDRVKPDDVQYFLEDGLLLVEHRPSYPIQFEVSPLLGLVGGDERAQQADRLLGSRSGQVLELLKDNIRLRVRLLESELKAAGSSNGHSPPAVPAPRNGAGG